MQTMHNCQSRVLARGRALPASRRAARASGTVVHAVATQGFLGECPPHAQDTVQSIREAVAHSTCSPFFDIALDTTLVINPAWAEEPRTTGLSDAVCGIATDTKYAEEHVRPIVASYETDGSVFLLWERTAKYADEAGAERREDICGVTYVKKNADGKATVLATFRQPSPEEMASKFKEDHGLVIRPGSDNFFDGAPYGQDNPVSEQQMVAAVREYYACWSSDDSEARLKSIADPKVHLKEPIWERNGAYLPVNVVEAAMYIATARKHANGTLRLEAKSIAHAEGTNMVFALWFASEEGKSGDTAGIDLFSFGEDLKIRSVASFREPLAAELSALRGH